MRRPDRPLKLSIVWSGATTPAGRFIYCHMVIESRRRGQCVIVQRWPLPKLERAIADKTVARSLSDLALTTERHLRVLRNRVLGQGWRKRKRDRYRAKFEALGRPLNLTEQDVFDRLLK